MDVLFIHNNFPGQFVHTSHALTRRKGVRVFGVGGPTAKPRPGVAVAAYRHPTEVPKPGHPNAERFNSDIIRGELAVSAMQRLQRDEKCDPALIVGHSGWGETIFAKDVFPNAKMMVFSEFFYKSSGSDVGFDPEFSSAENLRSALRVRCKNAGMLTSLAAADLGMSPTEWQKRQHPEVFWDKIRTIHDGIDTIAASPKPNARYAVPGTKLVLRPRDEVITFVNRQLEPYRGYHIFMRALPEILKRRPNAQVLIVGGDGVSYGAPAPSGKTWKQIFLDEVKDRLDLSRVHFLGNIPKPDFLALLQVSTCHVYLTYPFVLSWSLLEAMAAGCLIAASGTPPVREVITDGETGRLFDFFDVAGLTETVVDTLARRDELADMRWAAREFAVSNYDLDRVCLPKQLGVIDELLGLNSAKPESKLVERPVA